MVCQFNFQGLFIGIEFLYMLSLFGIIHLKPTYFPLLIDIPIDGRRGKVKNPFIPDDNFTIRFVVSSNPHLQFTDSFDRRFRKRRISNAFRINGILEHVPKIRILDFLGFEFD